MSLVLIVVGLLFVPQSVFAYELTLNTPSPSVEEGTTIYFTGIIQQPCDVCLHPMLEPAYGVIVHIKDHTNGSELTSDVSDIDGKFSAQWTAQYNPGNYMIYAVAYWENNTEYRSETYPLTVYQQPVENNIQLILEPPIPSITPKVGETLTFLGRLIAEEVFDKQIVLKADGVMVAAYETDQNGEFTLSWTPTKEGTYTVNAEYVSGHVDSNSYGIQVLPSTQLEIKIKTSQTNGVIPFTVTFNAIVAGGKEPYDYDWNIDNDIITQQSFTKKFVTAGKYPVTLTVTDSLSQTRTTKITILASNPPPPPFNPKIIQQPEKVQEGSEALFIVDEKNLRRVKSYEWRIDGDIISTSNKATYWFANDGSYVVLLNIIDTDGKTHSVSQSVSVLNVPPQITSNLQNYEIETSEELRVNVVYTDPGKKDDFTIEFFIDDRGIGEIKQSSHDAIFSFGRPTSGTYQARVVVTDNDGGKDERNFSIKIKEPRFPIEVVIGIIAAAGGGGGYGVKKYLDSRNNTTPHDLRIEIRIVRSGIER